MSLNNQENFFSGVHRNMAIEKIEQERKALEVALTEEIKKGNIRITMECHQIAGDIHSAPSWDYKAVITYPNHDAESEKSHHCHNENVNRIFTLNNQVARLNNALEVEKERGDEWQKDCERNANLIAIKDDALLMLQAENKKIKAKYEEDEKLYQAQKEMIECAKGEYLDQSLYVSKLEQELLRERAVVDRIAEVKTPALVLQAQVVVKNRQVKL